MTSLFLHIFTASLLFCFSTSTWANRSGNESLGDDEAAPSRASHPPKPQTKLKLPFSYDHEIPDDMPTAQAQLVTILQEPQSPHFSRHMINIAVCFHNLDQTPAALDIIQSQLRTISQEDQLFWKTRIYEAYFYSFLGDQAAAVKTYRDAYQNDPNVEHTAIYIQKISKILNSSFQLQGTENLLELLTLLDRDEETYGELSHIAHYYYGMALNAQALMTESAHDQRVFIDEAIESYDQFITAFDPDTNVYAHTYLPECYMRKGRLFHLVGRWGDAKNAYSEAIATQALPPSITAKAYFRMGEVYLAWERYEDAAQAFQSSKTVNAPEWQRDSSALTNIYLGKATALMESPHPQSQLKKGMMILNSTLKMQGISAKVRRTGKSFTAEVYTLAGNHRKAIDLYESLLDDKDLSSGGKAKCYLNIGTIYRSRAASIGKSDIPSTMSLLSHAEAALSAGLDLKELDGFVRARFSHGLGEVFFRRGELTTEPGARPFYEQTEIFLSSALKESTWNNQYRRKTLYLYASTLFRLGHWEEAEPFLEEYISAPEKDQDYIGIIYLLVEFNIRSQADPMDQEVYIQHAQRKYREGRFEQLEADVEKLRSGVKIGPWFIAT